MRNPYNQNSNVFFANPFYSIITLNEFKSIESVKRALRTVKFALRICVKCDINCGKRSEYSVFEGGEYMEAKLQLQVEDLIKKMTLEEKIGQLHQEPLFLHKVDEIKEKIKNGKIGSLIFAASATAGNDEQHKYPKELLNELERIAVKESRLGIPVFFGRDVIHGHNTVFPIPLALAATFNPELVENSYRCIAKEAAVDGIHWAFSPMIDISRDPRWGRCIEGIGEDPYLGELMAKAVVRGFQGEDYTKQDSIAACAKHYIGYGASEGGRDYGKAEISDYTLRNYYLKPFKSAVDAGVATVMSSFNEISGQPVTSSKYLLTEVLKEELGFNGYVVSDWGAVNYCLMLQGVAETRAEAASLAINAGVDMDMCSNCYAENLEDLVKNGQVGIEQIDKAVSRILYIKLLFGLFEKPFVDLDMKYDEKQHKSFAKDCSDEAMVLLKNDNNILPLSKDKKVLVTGPMLHEKKALFGNWTLDGCLNITSSIADALTSKSDNIVIPDSDYLWDDCLKQLRRCDAVIVLLGESQMMSGEGNSLSNIELPAEQLEFVKKIRARGKPVIGVMAFGRPLALENSLQYFDSILYAWHSGTCTADSIASILYGEVNPSGCIPMTFPRNTGQIPIYYNCPDGIGYGDFYYTDVGAYNDIQSTPLFPFGYGLSYTEFEYNDIYCLNDKISYTDIQNGEKFKIFATVKNIGKYPGKETSQCYIRDRYATMSRPMRELKGVSKNHLNPGEAKELIFELGYEELAYYNANSEFRPDPGKFEIYVGRDCYAPKAMTIEITKD